ncbi:hypothetical protein D4741_06680 [Pseudoalteromonas gelatinilytica]|uniref:Uncharacterized protein n=2 Tax=Pseudoalteromonas gelatinilytica TaxID=1703256 RepID=A0A3A3EPT5_9GAMM|nr:hypothetical protein D4741_06680 [Pseudoalteromonas profundi]
MNISNLIITIQQTLGTYLATLIMWGFLMTFLFNMVSRSSIVNQDKTLMWISLAIFLSYLLTDPLVSMAFEIESLRYASIFIIWCILDLTCLGIILLISRNSSIEKFPAKLYVIIGLLTNSSLFFCLYLDVSVYGNEERWWLWDLYTVTVNVMDLTMLAALLTNKDFFKLAAFLKFLKTKYSIQRELNA